MASWLLVAILAYLLFAFASLGDKLFLKGSAEPVSYTFYVGCVSPLLFLLAPFINFGFPETSVLGWIILEGMIYAAALYTMYTAIEKFDVSKVMAGLGATQPIIVFLLVWIFLSSGVLNGAYIAAFLLLFLGTAIISFEKSPEITGGYLKITLLASFLFSLDYVVSKIIFLNQPFLQALIWMRFFSFLTVLCFLFSKQARQKIFQKKNMSQKGLIFAGAQASGGLANILQSFSIALAPVAFLPIVNSLRGVQYIFLFIMTLLLSFWFPKVLKEGISKKTIVQKIISIILIALGLVIIAVS